MNGSDEHAASMNNRDWTTAQPDNRQRAVGVVQAVRMSYEMTERLFVLAQQRRISPNELIREIVEDYLTGDADEMITIRRSDLHRAIDIAVKNAT
ncbi:CopG family transcriptional regulator [Actinoplanes sp. NPDC049118]|uniref:ribbon-helix-helix domain-containing protein n=1 Tax=Actinoplanes sp. NPDC049118 TaxID=3155769 RepID=UPI0033CC71E9